MFIHINTYQEQTLEEVSTEKFSIKYGIYGGVKIKITAFQTILRVKSFDVGYKIRVPFKENEYNTDNYSIVNHQNMLYVGVGF
jgi:hypothetical protein